MAFKIYFYFLLIVVICSCNTTTERKATSPDTVTIGPHKIVSGVGMENRFSNVDISPMDMSYYPVNYPQLKMAKAVKTEPVMRVIYSRPHLQGRNLFNDILKYGEMWRLGANEATELDLYQTVSVGSKKLNKGRYTMYCIPQPDKWVIAINNDLDVWGLKPDSTKDVIRVSVPVMKNNPSMEYFTIVFEKANDGANLVMVWQDLEVKLLFKF